jgi:hypothetical protein
MRCRVVVGLVLGLPFWVLAGCADPTLQSPEALQAEYKAAVADAAVAEPSEVSQDLTALVSGNAELLWDESTGEARVAVVTWTSWTGYDGQVGQTLQTTREVWVTAVPEVEQFVAAHRRTTANMTLRLEQLLGLPPNNGKTRFVEFWVRPADLYRPSPDPEVTDREAEVGFPISAYTTVDPNYATWFQNQTAASYGDNGYPWTRLGYTYDWGNSASEVGLSEFVIRPGAAVTVRSVATTEDYGR